MLVTNDGIVFESRDGDLLRAQLHLNKHSLTGPHWEVVELEPVCDSCSDSPVVYNDYATEAGRAWHKENPFHFWRS